MNLTQGTLDSFVSHNQVPSNQNLNQDNATNYQHTYIPPSKPGREKKLEFLKKL